MSKEKTSQKKEKKKSSLKLEILEKMSHLTTIGLGLVAAKAWNSAIQTLFKRFFGEQSNLAAQFSYALFVTVFVVIITVYLSRAVSRAKDTLKDEEVSFLHNFRQIKKKVKEII